ncbi:CidA/LrgA family protein [Kineococcus glutinatus]|uniref:CidA/LrgA family protein n=1 Tax=Kineococcus glutinatus TaxID=1070872 RepID=A0ABP9HBG2_9ACTN
MRAPHTPPVLLGLAVLLALQLVGTAAVALLHLPVPGAVAGLVLLVALGAWRRTRSVPRLAAPAGNPLLAHLQLLFVPPGVGALLELSHLARNALPLALAVGASFVAGLLVAGRLLQGLLARHQERSA